MATTGYTYGIRNALQNKGVTNNRIGYNSKSGMVTIDGKDFIKPGTTSNGVSNTTQAGFNTAWGTFNAPAKTPVMSAAASAAKAAQAAKTRVTTPVPTAAVNAAPATAYNPVTPQQSTLDAIQKSVQQQQGFQFSGPEQPFSYDQTTDPAYQAQLAEAKRQVGIQQLDTNAILRGTGQGKSSYSESVAAQSGNNAIQSIANNLVPQLMAAAYQRYNDTANRDLQVQQANYGVGQDAISNLGNQYQLQNQEYFQNPMAEAQLTGTYQSQAIKQAIQDLNNLKVQTEASGITKDQRAINTKKADQIRSFLTSQGIDATQFGANVNSKNTLKLQNQGVRTLAGQAQDLQSKQANLNAALQVSDLTGRVVNPQSDYTGLFRQANGGKAPLTFNAQQAGIQNAQEDRRLGQTDRGLDQEDRRQTFTEESFAQEIAYKAQQDGIQNAIAWAGVEIQKEGMQLNWAELKEKTDARLIANGFTQEQIDQGWAGLDLEGQRLISGGSGGGGYEGLTQSQVIDSVKEQFAREVPVYDADGDQTGTRLQFPKAKDAKTKEDIYRSVTAFGLPDTQEDQTLIALGLTKKDIADLDKKFPKSQASTSSYNGSSGGITQASFKSGSSGLKFTNGTSGYNNYYQAQKFVGKPNFNSSGAVIAQAIKDGGYDTSWLAPTLELVARESSFNPNAANPDSSARGLFQFLDMTRNNYGGNKVNWSDPYQQAVAGLKYIKDRYKNPTRALQYWDKNKSY